MGPQLSVVKTAVVGNGLPKTFKVAIWVGISAGLTYVADNVLQLHWDANKQFILLAIINAILAGGNEVIQSLKNA